MGLNLIIKSNAFNPIHYIMYNNFSFYQLEEIFRKKKDRKEVAEDMQRFDQQVLLACECLLIVIKAAVSNII